MKRGDSQYRKTAVLAAKAAGKIIKKKFRMHLKIKLKGRTDLVTEVDKQAERAIIKIITKNFPSHNIVAEETGEKINHSDYTWYIDPLDGTANFAHGVPFFCTSVCLAYKKEPIVGVVFDPWHNEMFIAEKNKGAIMNGKPIHVDLTQEIGRALIGSDSGHFDRKRTVRKLIKIVEKVRGIRFYGAAALALCYVAKGRFDAYMTGNTTPWDVGAANLIVKEARGKVTTIEGKKWEIGKNDVLASNLILHHKILKITK